MRGSSRRRAAERARRGLARALIAGGTLLLGWVASSVLLSAWAGRSERLAFERLLGSRELVVANAAEWSDKRAREHERSRPAGPGERLALLELPELGLQTVLLEGTGEWALNRGVGRIQGTALPDERGNLGIAGHRDGYFRALRHLARGDRIRLRTPRGQREYRVDWVRVVRPDEVWVLDATEEYALTLVTCHPFWHVGSAPDRFVVRAVLAPPR